MSKSKQLLLSHVKHLLLQSQPQCCHSCVELSPFQQRNLLLFLAMKCQSLISTILTLLSTTAHTWVPGCDPKSVARTDSPLPSAAAARQCTAQAHNLCTDSQLPRLSSVYWNYQYLKVLSLSPRNVLTIEALTGKKIRTSEGPLETLFPFSRVSTAYPALQCSAVHQIDHFHFLNYVVSFDLAGSSPVSSVSCSQPNKMDIVSLPPV